MGLGGSRQEPEHFFEETDKDKKKSNSYNPYSFYMPQTRTEDAGRRLSKRRPLKFIDDDDSNSILVVGADAQRLKIIRK